MKFNLLTIGVLATSVLLTSCGSESPATDAAANEEQELTSEVVAQSTTYAVSSEGSVVNWTGSALAGAYAHSGTLSVSEGALEVTEGSVSGGSFTIDMTSMKATDENYSGEKTPEMLVGHLSQGDFFLVDSFPKATFVITKAEGTSLMGDLTIRNKTNPATITDVTVEEKEGAVSATGKLTFNRQNFDVAYDSGKKDFVISDDVSTEITLKAKK